MLQCKHNVSPLPVLEKRQEQYGNQTLVIKGPRDTARHQWYTLRNHQWRIVRVQAATQTSSTRL